MDQLTTPAFKRLLAEKTSALELAEYGSMLQEAFEWSLANSMAQRRGNTIPCPENLKTLVRLAIEKVFSEIEVVL